MLERYIVSCLEWTDTYKTQAQLWLAFLHRCTRVKSERAINSEAVHAGELRLTSLLEQGRNSGQFSHQNSTATAKAIQTLITGAMVTYNSEDHPDPAAFRELIRQQAMALAQKGHSAPKI